MRTPKGRSRWNSARSPRSLGHSPRRRGRDCRAEAARRSAWRPALAPSSDRRSRRCRPRPARNCGTRVLALSAPRGLVRSPGDATQCQRQELAIKGVAAGTAGRMDALGRESHSRRPPRRGRDAGHQFAMRPRAGIVMRAAWRTPRSARQQPRETVHQLAAAPLPLGVRNLSSWASRRGRHGSAVARLVGIRWAGLASSVSVRPHIVVFVSN